MKVLPALIVLLLLFSSCALLDRRKDDTPAPAATSGADSATLERLSHDVAALKRDISEVAKMHREINSLRSAVVTLQAKMMQIPDSGGEPTVPPKDSESARRNELVKIIADNSNVLRAWAGVQDNIQFLLFPMTKGEDVTWLNEQLGKEYSYLYLQISNNTTDRAWSFKPRKGFLRVEIEEADGAKHILCREPSELIEGQEKSVGGMLKELRDHFEDRVVLPGESTDTHVIFPSGVDFSKVKKLYWVEGGFQKTFDIRGIPLPATSGADN